jgi:hypothetical protein
MHSLSKKIAASVLLLTVFSSGVFAEDVNVRAQVLERPRDTSVGYGEVYGYVTYTSNLKDTSVATKFLDALVREQFASNTDGSFLVTLAVTKAGETKPIAERPIISGVRKSKKFLWITTQSTTSGAVDINGTLLDNLVVHSDTNKLRVSFRIYVSNKVTFDTKAYGDLIKIAEATKIATILAVPALITAQSASITTLLETALSRDTSREKTLATEMSFINKDGLNPDNTSRQSPKKQRFTITTTDSEDGETLSFRVEVTFETRPSIAVNYDPEKINGGPNRKGFSAFAAPSRFIEESTVQIGDAKLKLAELIEKSGPKAVATAWTTLRSSPYDPDKNGHVSIGAICSDLYSLIKGVYSERDSVGLYWDILHLLRTNLEKTAGAKECVEAKRALFDLHGLKTDDFKDIKS